MSSSLTGLKDGGVTTLQLLSTQQAKATNVLNTNGDWYYVIGNHKQDEAYPLSKAVENSGKVPFNQLASTKYPEVDLPTVGSMLAIWADKPSAEYKEEEIFELMTAFDRPQQRLLPC